MRPRGKPVDTITSSSSGWLDRLNRGPARVRLGAGEAEILHWAYDQALPDNRPHRHTYFEICQVGKYGAGRFIVDCAEHAIGPGDLFIARPGVVHQILNCGLRLMELYWICYQWTPVRDTAQGMSGNGEIDALMRSFAESVVLVVRSADSGTVAVWQALKELAASANGPAVQEQIQALTTALLLAIARAGAGEQKWSVAQPEPFDTVSVAARLALRYVHDNLNRPLPLEEIASHIHVSVRQLSRLFILQTGTSPAAYVARARIDRAAALLRTDLPIKGIAQEVGFADVHHFTRIFTRYAQCPPAKFRRERRSLPVPNIQKPGALV